MIQDLLQNFFIEIKYYRQNDSRLNLIFLDASKAFDKLWRDGLFFKLLNNVPDPIWRILYNYYRLSKIKIKYQDDLSGLIDTTEGVKQGGVLSPYLFNYFINDLIKRCAELNVGAKMNDINLSILAY
ncbi:unnamed protein product [Brachionus calyciflorus]|uniref:Reverse transcriptase domain-containing protein n=1 Tax=Brachionus calyciflorus TaxID=104777 RepID=A0A813Y036_9BILA|nr:unnamed protein product [Brachionus calyciflorus]